MSVTIEINSVDKSGDIEQESVSMSFALGKQPSNLSFVVKGNKTLPTLGQSIVVKDNGVNVFKGIITDRTDEVIGKLVIKHKFSCMDGYYELDSLLISKAYNDTTAGVVILDIINTFTTGFTLDIPASTPIVKTIRFNYEQPSSAFNKIANIIGWDWYIDANYVVHFFPPNDILAPYEINDTDGNLAWSSLDFTSNLTELKNVVYVRGGEYDDAIAGADAIDSYLADGTQTAFPLVYRYSNVQVTVDAVAKTVGVDYVDSIDDFDCLYNYQEKLVRFPSASKPTVGQLVKVFGDAKVPIIVQAIDSTSIVAYGTREAIEINKSINSIEEAELLASSLIDLWKDGSKEGSFRTNQSGFVVGQTVTINSVKFGVNTTYKINRVKATLKTKDELEYEIQFLKSGQTTLADILVGLIGKEKDNIVISNNEVIQKLRTVDDDFSMTDEIVSVTKKTGPYYWSPVTGDHEPIVWDFFTWS